MTGHVPPLVLQEALDEGAEEHGDDFFAVYKGRGGGYEEAVGCPPSVRATAADRFEGTLRSWLIALSTILGVGFGPQNLPRSCKESGRF